MDGQTTRPLCDKMAAATMRHRARLPEFQPALAGVDLTSRAVQPGDSFAGTLTFKNAGRKETSRAYRVFPHFEAPKLRVRTL